MLLGIVICWGKTSMTLKNAVSFLEEVRNELLKVVWPKMDEFFKATLVVLILVVLFAVYLGAVDLFFTNIAKYIFKLYGGY